MTYAITSPVIGTQPIANTETTQKHPLGTIVRANDPTYGEGEFIYLLGVASTVAGSIVTYDAAVGTTALAVAGTNLPRPVAVAMSANVANQYGWYQISGTAIASKAGATSLVQGAALGVTATGVVGATATGAEVLGALVMVTATTTATTVQVAINRPHMQGRIT